MVACTSIFLTASEARQNPIREAVVHEEARLIENKILESVRLGLYEATISNGTPMTNSNRIVTAVWTVNSENDQLYIPNHSFQNGDTVTVNSTIALPAPLNNYSYYYVIYVDVDHIKLAASMSDALAGRPISIDITSGVISIDLTDNGGGYIQSPVVTISGGDPVESATATAYLSTWGTVVDVSNTTTGSGYTDLPSVNFSQQGSGAVIGTVSYQVVGATIFNSGSGYSVGDVLTVLGGNGVFCTLSVTSVNLSGSVLSVNVINPGNYTTIPPVVDAETSVSPSGGTACTLNLTIGLKSIAVSNGGTNYVAAPRVVINSGSGTGATAYATIYGGSVTNIVVTNPGYGYLNISSIDLDTGSNATAVASLLPTSVASTVLTNDGGETYVSIPNVTVTPLGNNATIGTVYMKVISVTMISSGKNYAVGDSLLVSGGSAVENAWIKVTSVDSAGRILAYILESGGSYTSLPGLISNPVNGGTGTLAAFNLTVGVGSIDIGNPGTGYIVPPVVNISAPPIGNAVAKAKAIIESGSVTGFKIINSGYGFTDVPLVTLSNGNGAIALAHLTPTIVDTITVYNKGSGYTDATVTIVGGGATVDATAVANIIGDQIDSITLLTNGSGYTDIPAVIIEGDGIGAEATANLYPTTLSSVSIINGGTGYNAPPIINIDGDATAEAVMVPTGISDITVTNQGQNYVADPVVYLIPGNNQVGVPTSPVMFSQRAFSVGRISVTYEGQGYQSTPSVTLAAPFYNTSNTATASASIGAGLGTFVVIPYPASKDYYKAWKGQALSNEQLLRPYIERMDTIVSYFTNLGYNINRLSNPATNNTFMWFLQW